MNPVRKALALCLSCFVAGMGLFGSLGVFAVEERLSYNEAEVVGISAPDFIFPGQTFSATVTLRNTGNKPWSRITHFLDSQNPPDNLIWCDQFRLPLPRETVLPGEEVDFRREFTAPLIPGTYPFVWRMSENLPASELEPWFGALPRKNIIVVARTNDLDASAIGKQAARFVPQYISRLWQTDDGLPQNFVQAIAQTRDGYLWVGTQRGLARFDGVHFGVFHPGNTPVLKSESIYALCATRDGSLWIGGFDGGLVQMKNGLFSRHESLAFENDPVRVIFEGRDSSIWIGTTNGLVQFKDGKTVRFTKTEGLAGNVIRSLDEDTDGSLWIGTPDGVNRLADGKVTTPPIQGSLPGAVRTVRMGRNGSLWIGAGMGVACRNAEKISCFMKEDGLPDNMVSALCQDSWGDLWVGTYGGLCRLAGGRWITETTSDGSAYTAVSCLMEDAEGNIWVGAKDGLFRLSKRQFTTYTQQNGLAHNNVISVTEDRTGAIWAGTWGGGINQLVNGKFTQLNALSFDLVLSVHEDQSGNLWVGADYDGGLNSYRDGIITRYMKTNGLVDPAIRVIYSDRAGNLWLGTSGSLTLFKDGKFTRYTRENGLAGNNVRAIDEDREGNLWVGTNDGLSRFKDGRFRNFFMRDGLSRDTVVAIHEDRDGDLWLGTTGGGVNRLHQDHFTSYTSKHGLFSDDIHEILEDDFGYFWMSCRNGVFRVSKKDFDELDAGKIARLTCQSFGKQDGMISVECNSVGKPSAWKGRDGRLWFATAKGLTTVDPLAGIQRNEMPPPMVIEDVVANKQSVTAINRSSAVLENGIHDSTAPGFKELVIPPGPGDLEIRYTALSFRQPEKVQFKYKLEGHDSDWIEAGSRRVSFYNSLSPGDYIFRVMGCNNDGVWNSIGASMKVTLEPHFWQTIWFLSLVGLGVAGSLAGAVRYITWKKVQASMRHLEHQRAVDRERARIAQDMHDDLGARLTEIMFLSGMAENSKDAGGETKTHVGRISGAARELVQNLDAIVWAVNPQNDTLGSLVMYLHDYADRFLTTSGIRGRFKIQKDLPAHTISSQTRHSVLLATKEALNNIAKHAACTEVQFQLHFVNDRLLVSICDNGRGFSPATVSGSGNGLQNMDERLRSIGGTFEIKSEPGEGTEIQLSFPVAL